MNTKKRWIKKILYEFFGLNKKNNPFGVYRLTRAKGNFAFPEEFREITDKDIETLLNQLLG